MCSDGMSNDTRLSQLKKIFEDEHSSFDKFNTTSVFSVLYSCTGMYGDEIKAISIEVLRHYVNWLNKNNLIFYMPKTGLEIMFHPTLIEKIVDWCEKLPPNEVKDDNIDEKHKILNELSKKFRELEAELKSNNSNNLIDKYRIYYGRRYIINSSNMSIFVKSCIAGIFIGITGIFFKFYYKKVF